jgi:hypothetical protein
MLKRPRSILFFALLLALPRLSCAAAPTRQEALEAIAVLERAVSGPDAVQAAKTVVVYAQLSDDVVVNIGDEELPWLSEDWGLNEEKTKACQSMLVAAYVAGNVKAQLKAGHAADDTYSGWLMAIDAYRRLKARADFTSPSIESLGKMESEGTLRQHAKELSEQQEESPDASKKQAA